MKLTRFREYRRVDDRGRRGGVILNLPLAAALVSAWALCQAPAMAQSQPQQQDLKAQTTEANQPVKIVQPPKLVEVSQPPQFPPQADATPKPSANAAAGPRPIAEVADKGVFDFGDVWVGEPVAHTFVIKNIGDAEMEIVKVQPG